MFNFLTEKGIGRLIIKFLALSKFSVDILLQYEGLVDIYIDEHDYKPTAHASSHVLYPHTFF